jgi:hypothetical protein
MATPATPQAAHSTQAFLLTVIGALAPALAMLATPSVHAQSTPAPAYVAPSANPLDKGQMPIIGTRQFPTQSQRGTLEVKMPPVVTINGTEERLSPGSRIRGPNNQLVMSGQLVGRSVQVNYVRNSDGQIHEVWILNGLEAREEREGSGPVRNYRFESQIEADKAKAQTNN